MPDGQVIERLACCARRLSCGYRNAALLPIKVVMYVLHYANALALHPQFLVDSPLALAYTHRESEVTWPVQSHKENNREWISWPSLGVRYQIQPETRALCQCKSKLRSTTSLGFNLGVSDR